MSPISRVFSIQQPGLIQFFFIFLLLSTSNAVGKPTIDQGSTSGDLVPSYWHVDTYNAENLNGNGAGNHAAWCGSIEYQCGRPEYFGGYGNNIHETLSWSVQIMDPTQGSIVDIEAWLNYDVEPGFDYINIGFVTAGSTNFYPVAVLTGTEGNSYLQAAFTYEPGDYVGASGDMVRLEIIVTSDEGWSDEDCNWDTRGAVQIDDIRVQVVNDGMLWTDFEDFEGGGLGMWVPTSQDEAVLSDPVLVPAQGEVGDTFTWSVVWTEWRNKAPSLATVRLISPSGSLSSHWMTTGDTNFYGAVYSKSVELNEIGVYSYYFYFENDAGQSLYLKEEDGNHFIGPVVAEHVNQMPTLTDVVLDPVTGPPGSEFDFSITYWDPDNDFPNLGSNLLIKNPITDDITLHPMMTEDTDCRDGAIFTTTVELADLGTYQYQFSFFNLELQGAYMPEDVAEYLVGPLVEEGGPAGPFTEIGAGLPGVAISSAAWGDYDGDGDLDIILTGFMDNDNGSISRIYGNEGGIFTDIGAGLTGVSDSSVAWGDYDNDGDLDVLVTGWAPSSQIYRNDGGIFVDAEAGLQGVYYSSVAWGDYDNDGDLDILLSGTLGILDESISLIYQNDGGVFSDIGAGLVGVERSSVAWGDYDLDGDLDVLLSGRSAAGDVSLIYRNDEGSFTDIDAGLTGVYASSVAWGDCDNDGDLDILLTGSSEAGRISLVYRNDGGVFQDTGAQLAAVASSSVAWGDYDNDGDLDILLTGIDSEEIQYSVVYRNDSGVFTDIDAGLQAVSGGSSACWGDYDGDGDLDILLTGPSDGERYSKIYRNDLTSPNGPPSRPSSLASTVDGSLVTFWWDPASDIETPTAGLSYNFRIGTTPGGNEICPAMADSADGYRRIVQLGNVQQSSNWTIQLAPGIYYWSLQAIDGAFAGSPFASEQMLDHMVSGVEESGMHSRFALDDASPNPFNPSTKLSFEMAAAGHAKLTVYDAAGRLVVMLVDGHQEAGRHEATWNGRDHEGRPASAGVYLYRLEVAGFSETKRMVLLK